MENSLSTIDQVIPSHNFDFAGLNNNYCHLSSELVSPDLNFIKTSLKIQPDEKYEVNNLVIHKRVNDARRVNKLFESANQKLEKGDSFICFFESKEQRKKNIFEKYPFLLAYLFYYILDFPWKRVCPKIKGLQKLYFGLTKGQNQVLSTSEVMGRLASCGFQICDRQEINSKTYIYTEKVSAPSYDENPTYSPLITLDRIGHKGKMIKVYKLRTMYPYSEYLQKFVYDLNGTKDGDKIENDFRVTNWGRLFRKLWIDELPMLINYFKGQLKLVGVRPLSQHKFNTYPDSLQKKRIKYKPGMIPPFYADLPENVEEFYKSEEKYLELYSEFPIKTDITYFFKALHNILIKRVRSK